MESKLLVLRSWSYNEHQCFDLWIEYVSNVKETKIVRIKFSTFVSAIWFIITLFAVTLTHQLCIEKIIFYFCKTKVRIPEAYTIKNKYIYI